MTIWERVQAIFAFALLVIVVVVPVLVILFVVGMMIDAETGHRDKLHRCLQQAHNGLEIEDCKNGR